MKKLLMFVLAMFALVLVGCGTTYELTIKEEDKSVSLLVGEEKSVVAEFTEGATLNWVSSNEEIATVSGGLIKAVKEGTAIVTVSIKENASVKAEITVTVTKKSDVMTYQEYMAAEVDTAVVIEGYVQAKQSWWEDKATVYLQDQDGAYFVYNMTCTEANYALLTKGTKIKVTGVKAEWSGEIEIVDATFEILEGTYVAAAVDVTSLLGTDDLIAKQNQFVSFKNMTVVASKDAEGKDVSYLYKYNGSGEEGDDLYFKVSVGGKEYTFTVESYLCDKNTEVYQKVKSLKIGDAIDMEGFLYWYNGVNPHITSVSTAKGEGVMTYQEYMAAEVDTAVVIEGYVQAKQSWWEDKATVYLQDQDGAYFVYNMTCTEANYALLTKGTKIKVTGVKAEWSGEIEIVDATFEILEGTYVAAAVDVTSLLGTDDLIAKQNQFVSFKNMTVVASKDAEGKDVSYLYKYNGSGEEGDDLYFKVSVGGKEYTFTVESYLCDKNTEVYQQVKLLKIGDVIDMEGFLYWYNGVNPHITSVTSVEK